MENESYKRILKYLTRHNKILDETYKIIILDLLNKTNFDYSVFKKMLKGAYVTINDHGYFYKKWILDHKKILRKKNKFLQPILSNLQGMESIFNQSSHDSCSPQYRLGNGIIFNLDNEMTNMYDILLGTNCTHIESSNHDHKKNKCNTWFQIERSRISNILSTIGHVYDYLTYLVVDQNIGPFGHSEHTETNDPIILKLK
jgi:hypothetical protein